MFITKKHIPRRTFLRGCRRDTGLPLLESMVPAQTPLRLTAAGPARRFVGIWHPHGASPGYWSPAAGGPDFEFSYITKPLEPFRDRVVLITGLTTPDVSRLPTSPAATMRAAQTCFPAPVPEGTAVFPYLGVTIDQLIAKKYGQDTIIGSIQLGVEDPGNNIGNCNWGYSCAYTELGVVVVADAAAADPSESARGLRALVRRRHERGGTAGGSEAEREHPRFGDPRARSVQEGPRRRRSGAARRLSREHP